MEMRGGEKERPDGGQEEGGSAPHGRPFGGGGGGGTVRRKERDGWEGGRNKSGRVVIHSFGRSGSIP